MLKEIIVGGDTVSWFKNKLVVVSKSLKKVDVMMICLLIPM